MKITTYIFLSVFWITLISSTLAYAGSTQTNTSGSNTAIEGGLLSEIIFSDELVFELRKALSE